MVFFLHYVEGQQASVSVFRRLKQVDGMTDEEAKDREAKMSELKEEKEAEEAKKAEEQEDKREQEAVEEAKEAEEAAERAREEREKEAYPCTPKKKIVLLIKKGGLGNRMVAIASTVLLAIKMDRVVELTWEKDFSCDEDYDDLFVPPPTPNDGLQPFVYNGDESVKGGVLMNQKFCRILFNDQTHEDDERVFQHFKIITDPELFKKFNSVCGVIRLETNLWHGHLILGRQFGSGSEHMENEYRRPFHDLAKILFTPNDGVMKKVKYTIEKMEQKMIAEHGEKKKWLSFQSREFFTKEWANKDAGN